MVIDVESRRLEGLEVFVLEPFSGQAPKFCTINRPVPRGVFREIKQILNPSIRVFQENVLSKFRK